MKPTKEQILQKYCYDGKNLVFAVDSGRGGRYKAGTVAGSVSESGIRMLHLNGKYYQAHQLIWCIEYGCWPTRVIRHIDGNLDNNELQNLTMDSDARGKVDAPLNVERLRQVLNYDPATGMFTWKVSLRNRTLPGDKAGYMNNQGYMLCVIDQQKIRLHRAAWAIYYGTMPEGHLDHINGVRHDNRIENLRIATASENMQNTALRKNSTTKVKGIHLRKDTGKYSSSITVNGVTHWLGCFDNISDAKRARLAAENTLHPFNATERIY
jgi:hypothetical protein